MGVAGSVVASVGQQKVLSQAINGFHDNMLGRINDIQLPVFDPYLYRKGSPNWAAEDEVSQEMIAAIGRFQQAIPHPSYQYNPIQNGLVEIIRVRIIDAFGQYRDIQHPKITKPLELQAETRGLQEGEEGLSNLSAKFALAPRMAQSARLSFNWLSAYDDALEMNAHPSSSPICGWIMSNHLDNSLAVFNQSGELLGSIQSYADRADAKVNWSLPPLAAGEPLPPKPEEIGNPHLKSFVQSLLQENTQNFNQFRETIERVLLSIVPPNSKEEEALAVMMGRPLALVQTSLQLELKGGAASAWSEDAFKAYVNTAIPEKGAFPRLSNRAFPKVEIPVRLGDLALTYDGLLGYWKGGDFSLSQFQAEDTADSLLLSGHEGAIQLQMLIDPRAKIHATSGVLPVKAIEIPPSMYTEALKNMRINFLVNPLLSPQKQIQIPLPEQSLQNWSWLSPTAGGNGWKPAVEEFAAIDTQATHGFPKLQLLEGWLRIQAKKEK